MLGWLVGWGMILSTTTKNTTHIMVDSSGGKPLRRSRRVWGIRGENIPIYHCCFTSYYLSSSMRCDRAAVRHGESVVHAASAVRCSFSTPHDTVTTIVICEDRRSKLRRKLGKCCILQSVLSSVEPKARLRVVKFYFL